MILHVILRELRIKHTRFYSDEYEETHPYRDSLYGLFLMLKHYGIASKSYCIKDKNKLSDIDTPFIAETTKGFCVVRKIENNTVLVLLKERKVLFDDFLR